MVNNPSDVVHGMDSPATTSVYFDHELYRVKHHVRTSEFRIEVRTFFSSCEFCFASIRLLQLANFKKHFSVFDRATIVRVVFASVYELLNCSSIELYEESIANCHS